MRRVAPGEDWLNEIKVTFDSSEMATFFDGFSPLEIGDDLVPVIPVASNDDC